MEAYYKLFSLLIFLFLYIWVFIILKIKRANLYIILKMKERAKIIDLRSSKDYNHSHFPKAINIPFNNLYAKKDKIGSFDTKIIVYSNTYLKAQEGKKILKDIGFKDITVAGSYKNILKFKELLS